MKFRKLKRDRQGCRVGSFTAIKYVGKQRWECVCDCGRIKILRGDKFNHPDWFPICSSECPFKVRKKVSRRSPGENGLLAMYRNYKKQVPRRNIEWNISVEEFKKITSSNCYYCGSAPSNTITAKYAAGKKCTERFTPQYIKDYEYTYNGIDRVDSKIGYVFGNCVAACTKCNYAKNTLEEQEFIHHIKKIYEFQSAKNT